MRASPPRRARFPLAALLLAGCADRSAPTAPDVPGAAEASSPGAPSAGQTVAGSTYAERFDFLVAPGAGFGTPTGPPWPAHAPRPWTPTDFDVAIHSRDPSTWYQPETFRAMHGTDCGPYQTPEPASELRPGDAGTHAVSSYAGLNYQCRNHMMTALKATGYGSIYLTPAAIVDFSSRAASITFALSTLRMSAFDWIDVWITPWADNLVHPIDAALGATVDLQGVPRNAIHVRMVPGVQRWTRFDASLVSHFTEVALPTLTASGYESVLAPVSTRRDTFELRLSRDRLRFGMRKGASPAGLAQRLDWVDVPLAVPWTRGVVQFGHHSMNPERGGGSAGTWHWDDITVTPAVPFSIVRPKLAGGARRRYVDAQTAGEPVEFERPAPPDAFLRFAAYGTSLQVSVDGGARWIDARIQPASLDRADRFRSYWTPIPTGVTSIRFRRSAGAGPWMARDLAIWSLRP